jgi:hypothetical protein
MRIAKYELLRAVFFKLKCIFNFHLSKHLTTKK